jgi:Fur family ferric uptake transcriptional regulator
MKLKPHQRKPHDLMCRKLHSAGYKCTPQRYEVFDEILRLGGHVSAEELAERLRRRSGGPAISRATVYRTLPVLLECGLVREVLFTDKHTHYEAVVSREHHEHMVCTRCGRTIEFDDSDLERALRKIARAARFSPVSHKVEVYGLCDRCRRSLPAT